ncbi:MULTISPECIES: TrbG/VirB9 family P-type conjugative transfer protein [Prosthecochloris]|uniref:Conjugal transfer protein TrbG n=1 Tax=Prosthecochloris vibrioformis TaxID=1098 RepID=A0A5C4S4I4_PROVB|nr:MULTISPECIES: TrbG/VirB9 family P-type conjugative transfer protein [Prosthecochloris]ANT65600.1 conjugal transfer protein TrbG [Prosthecochloris sp. CIB 2401]TNJ38019.1 hypothetical protein FGF68_02240 [Prosthecochloris vibrioformis]
MKKAGYATCLWVLVGGALTFATAVPAGHVDAAENSEDCQDTVLQIPDGTYSVMHYDFKEKEVFNIFASPGIVTDIRLQEGEKVMGAPYIRDTDNWSFIMKNCAKPDMEHQHILLTAKYSGITSMMEIVTDKRTYQLHLHSYDGAYVQTVKWNYTTPSKKNDSVAERIVN